MKFNEGDIIKPKCDIYPEYIVNEIKNDKYLLVNTTEYVEWEVDQEKIDSDYELNEL